MAAYVEITDTNFEELVIKSGKPVLLDFWAVWCPPCITIGSLVEELATEYAGVAVIGKVNVDENPGVSHHFKVRHIPTLIYMKDGKQMDKHVGAVSKSALETKLKAVIANT